MATVMCTACRWEPQSAHLAPYCSMGCKIRDVVVACAECGKACDPMKGASWHNEKGIAWCSHTCWLVKHAPADGDGYGGKVCALAESFPSLRGKPGVRPWDPIALDNYMKKSGAGTSGSLAAARFILSVWNTTEKWKIGKFTLGDVAKFDDAHARAFALWAANPYFF